jgi:hypothetical protein
MTDSRRRVTTSGGSHSRSGGISPRTLLAEPDRLFIVGFSRSQRDRHKLPGPAPHGCAFPIPGRRAVSEPGPVVAIAQRRQDKREVVEMCPTESRKIVD